MDTTSTQPSGFTKYMMNSLKGSVGYLVVPPIALFIILINIGTPHETAWHSVMSYLLVLGILTMFWVALRKHITSSMTRGRVLFLGAVGGFTYAMNEMALEPLFPAGVAAFCLLGWKSSRGDRMSQITLLAAGIIVASATFHHIEFLDRFVTHRIHDRLEIAKNIAGAGSFEDTGTQGCMIDGLRFETCKSFADEHAGGFTDTDWFIEFMDNLRDEQARVGGVVSEYLRDRNDDLPVWGVSFDGDRWFIVGGHDALYRDRVVPVMGLLWWWSFFVWGSLGATVIDWHKSTSTKDRRSEAYHALYWSAGTAVTTCVVLLASSYLIQFLPAISEGDYRPEDFEILQKRMAEVAIAIPIAWVFIGLGLWAMHEIVIKKFRRSK